MIAVGWPYNCRRGLALLLLCLANLTPVVAAPAAPAAGIATRPYALPRTDQFVLKSADGRAYEVSVALPVGDAPKSGYPAIYLLDLVRGFAALVETVQNREFYVGPAVVVGIGYPPGAPAGERQRDLTTKPDLTALPEAFGQPSGPLGGADEFLQFIETRVKPAIQAKYRIDRDRQALFGHSYGGYFVLHALFTRPGFFQTYVAASPSIWWNRALLFGEAREFKRSLKAERAKRRLLITVGASEAGIDASDIAFITSVTKPADLAETLSMQAAYLTKVAMVANSEAMAALLSEGADPSIEVRLVVFPEENHDSVIPAYLSRSASFMLNPRQ